MEISINNIPVQDRTQITVGDIICCEAFCYGIRSIHSDKEIGVGWSEEHYQAFLTTALTQKEDIDAFDASRSYARFLVLSMEMVEVIIPEDIDEDSHYLGINVQCIRLTNENGLSRDAERIFFTLRHPMSCLDMHKRNIEIVSHADLPVYWFEKVNDGDEVERGF